MPIAGSLRFTRADLLMPTPWATLLTFVATSGGWLASGRWPSSALAIEPTERYPGIPDDGRDLTHTSTEYFTIDLVRLLGEEPPLGALYVYAFVGRHISNVARLDLAPEEE
ncbi:MAG: hypothetical protein U0271_27745 [Polyangiaceae bacterium]